MIIQKIQKLVLWLAMVLMASGGFSDSVYSDDFETGDNTNPDGWLTATFSGTADYITDGTSGLDVYAGTHAISVSNPTNKQERWYLGSGDVPVAIGSVTYVMTAWVKAEGIDTAEVYISMDWLNASKGRVGLVKSSALTINTEWIQISVTGTAHADTAFIRPVLYIQNTEEDVDAGAIVTFDNVEINVFVPEVDDSFFRDDFEIGDSTNPDGWLSTTFEGVAEYITDGIAGLDVYEGAHALSVIGATNKQERWYMGTGDVPAASENVEYTMTVWVKTEGLDTAEAYISMDWLNASKSRVGLVKGAAITVNQDWAEITVVGVSKIGTAYIRPVLYLQNTEAGVDADARVIFDSLKIMLPPPEVGKISIEMVGQDAVVSWQGYSDQSYALQRKLALGVGVWSNVVEGVAGADGTLSATNAADELSAFYQIIME